MSDRPRKAISRQSTPARGAAVGVILARGSKAIPRKNVRPFAGRPLICHTIDQALSADSLDSVCVITDDDEVRVLATNAGADVLDWPDEVSAEEAPAELAVVRALPTIEERLGRSVELVVFLQPSLPLRPFGAIDESVATLRDAGADSLVSVWPLEASLWHRRGDRVNALSDVRTHPEGGVEADFFAENGSIYVTTRHVLVTHRNRLGGQIALFPMDPWCSTELDQPEDWALAEWIHERRFVERLPAAPLLARARLIVTDFDGVLTDNRVLVMDDGREAVLCDRSDGLGADELRKRGIEVVVLSTERNPVVERRCQKLRLEFRQGLTDKLSALRSILEERHMAREDTVFVGNDVNDLACMRFVGCAVAPANAVEAVKEIADIHLQRRGGAGAFRELCDLLIRLRDGGGCPAR